MTKKSKIEASVSVTDRLETGTLIIQEAEAYATDQTTTSLRIEGIQNNDLNNSSPDIVFQRDPANGNSLAGNYCMEMTYKAKNDAGNMASFGTTNCYVSDPAAGAQKGNVITTVACGDGSTTQALKVRGGTKGTSTNVFVSNGPLVHFTPPSFAADDVTPSVAGGNFFNAVENDIASSHVTLTALDDGIPGQMVVIRSSHATNAVQIDDGGNFLLAGNWDPDGVGETITLINFSGNTWTEISRSDNA